MIHCRRLTIVFLLSMAVCLPVMPAIAGADVVVQVGYDGGPFYDKATFSSSQLEALGGGKLYTYSMLSKGPALRKWWAYGAPATSIIAASGIDTNPNVLWYFYFGTEDGYKANIGGGHDVWSIEQLYATRYYYDASPKYYAFDMSTNSFGHYKEQEAQMAASAVPVETIVSTRSASFKTMTLPLPASEMYQWTTPSNWQSGHRLLFGQSQPGEMAADSYANSIDVIMAIFVDKPVIELKESQIELEMGKSVDVTPVLVAHDPVIAEQGVKDIKWTSTNPDAVTVTANDDGTFTVTRVGEGEAIIGGTYGNSSLANHRATASMGVGFGDGTGDSTGDEQGEGTGFGSGVDGSGNGSGDEGDGPGGDQDSENTDAQNGSANPTSGEMSQDAEATDVEVPQAELQAAAEGASGNSGGGSGVWKLSIAETEEATPTQTLDFDNSGAWIYGVGLGGLMLLGGLRRVGAFELAKDPYQRAREKEKPQA